MVKNNNYIARVVYDTESNFKWLKTKRIPISASYRQAMKALRENKIKYNHEAPALSKDSKFITRVVYDTKENFDWLKTNGIPIAGSFRQAVAALQAGKIKFDPLV